jgi:hypothetical protein
MPECGRRLIVGDMSHYLASAAAWRTPSSTWLLSGATIVGATAVTSVLPTIQPPSFRPELAHYQPLHPGLPELGSGLLVLAVFAAVMRQHERFYFTR